ncbi:uncharacterized protein LOC114930499 [Nylanderia fulva]|uniref:uncharacterized protein LOC114930499 n=1 Tax=Nylanderia fulva TaxID=613905 RepID=UPI0010FB8BBD|nr:uncharacterized protein LOC114930499 [Nylanderia fulva]
MDPEMKTTIDIAYALYGKISRAYENLQKLGTPRITLSAVEARLQTLKRNWNKFDSQNDDLLDHLDEDKDEPYLVQNIPALAEEVYLLNKGLLLDEQRRLRAQEGLPTSETKPVAPTSALAARVSLPPIQQPIFSGKFEDWLAFRDLFKAIVVDDPFLADAQRIHYLKTSVQEDAEKLIRNLPATEDNF